MKDEKMTAGEMVATGAGIAWFGLCILNYFAGVALAILVIVKMFT